MLLFADVHEFVWRYLLELRPTHLWHCLYLTALNWTSTREEHLQNWTWLYLWISKTSEGLSSPKHRWIHSGRQTHPYLLCKTSSYKTLGLHTHACTILYHVCLSLCFETTHSNSARLDSTNANQHITRLAYMLNSAHDKNSTCVVSKLETKI